MRYQKIGGAILAPLVFLILVQVSGADQGRDSLARSAPTQAPGLAGPADPSAQSSLQMVGQVGGRTEDVAVQGDYAYVAVGLRLVVLEVSQPITPTEVGSTTPFPQFVEGVAVSDTLAYVADGMAGLRIVDVSVLTDPVEVGAYDTPGYAEGVAVAGQYAYVADGHYGLRIVDVSDPADPTEVAYAYPLNYVFDVALDDHYAYLVAAGAGLLIVDISDPTHPVEMGTYDTPGYAYGVDVADGVAYVADGWEDLRVVSITDPAHPEEVGFYNTPGWSFDVTVSGTVAYVADTFAGLQVLDVSDPAQPAELGGYEVSGGHAGRVAVAGNTAYVADRNWGLRVVDVSDPGAPNQIGFYGSPGYTTAVAVSGDYAYLATATQGLWVVDVSDPAHPVEVGVYDTQSKAIGVVVDGNYAYVATFGFGTEIEAGLHVVDVSDPAHPTRVGYYGPVWASRDMVVSGAITYIADEWGFDVVDVSSPYTPTLAADVNLQGEEWAATTGVDISGTLAYVAGEGGLHIVDVSNPVSPTLISNFNISEGYFDVAAAGTQAYVTGGGSCLKIIDVSDPLHPTQTAAYCGTTLPERVSVADSTAYVAFGGDGLHAIDITDPLSPTLAFSYDTLGYAISSAVLSNTIYVADAYGGLLVLEMGEARSGAIELTWSESLSAMTAPSTGTSGLPAIPGLSRRLSPIHYGRYRVDMPPDALLTHHQFDVRPTPNVRRIASTCVVTSTADSGPSTLRECMENAVNGDTITFDVIEFPSEHPVTITLQSSLPMISCGNLTIDASDSDVVLNGDGLSETGISISSDGNAIRGLQILDFSFSGVSISEGAKHNVIGGNRTRGNGPTGEGNVISNNGIVGVNICDSGTMYNAVIGNLIGTDVSGTSALGNGFDGVNIYHGASFNRIGSLVPGEGNIISGNKNGGIACSTDRTMGNMIIGNFIGTDITGNVDLGNGWTGVIIETGSFYNTVKGNLISGNDWGGVVIGDWGSNYNTVVGNLIGTDASGTQAIGNRAWGVAFGENFNRIGGTSSGDGNVISGNPQGISLQGNRNLILGNFIGTNISGTQAISNSRGVFMCGNTSHSFVGGATNAERNVISGNGGAGISVEGAERVFILGNYIGTDASGAVALINKMGGIETGSAKRTVIQGNLIGGNRAAGVSIGDGSSFSHLRANRIGVAVDDTSPLPNGSHGVSIWAASNIVGGPYLEDGNIIAFNTGDGVQVWTHPGNTIRRNAIYGNSGSGIHLVNGGNEILAAPIITSVSPSSVSGTAWPGCIVEVFSDEADEGQAYEGYAVADGNGDWTWTGGPNGPYVTATATDGTGNTSPFSAPQLVMCCRLYLPLTLRGED